MTRPVVRGFEQLYAEIQVDPGLRLVEVYELAAGRIVLAATARDDDEVALPPFDAPLAIGRWWLPPPAPAATESP